MTRHTLTALSAVASLVLIAPGCSSDGGLDLGNDTMGLMDQASSLVQGDWNLDSLAGESANSLLSKLGQGGQLPSMSVGEDGSVSGFSGVNRWMSDLDMSELAKGNFELSPAASTLMAGSDEAMGLEQQFFSALSQVESFDFNALKDGALRLLDSNGAELMKFIR